MPSSNQSAHWSNPAIGKISLASGNLELETKIFAPVLASNFGLPEVNDVIIFAPVMMYSAGCFSGLPKSTSNHGNRNQQTGSRQQRKDKLHAHAGIHT